MERFRMKDYLEYKGYNAKISYSQEDDVLFGNIYGINDLVTFEGETITEIKNAFYEAVDDYLDMCSRIGKEPEKSYKGQFNVRISPQLHKDIAKRSVQSGISLNQYVEEALKEYVTKE
jgi:predicted HicB family RNase H-like nuclease